MKSTLGLLILLNAACSATSLRGMEIGVEYFARFSYPADWILSTSLSAEQCEACTLAGPCEICDADRFITWDPTSDVLNFSAHYWGDDPYVNSAATPTFGFSSLAAPVLEVDSIVWRPVQLQQSQNHADYVDFELVDEFGVPNQFLGRVELSALPYCDPAIETLEECIARDPVPWREAGGKFDLKFVINAGLLDPEAFYRVRVSTADYDGMPTIDGLRVGGIRVRATPFTPPNAADFDFSGRVDAGDLRMWEGAFGTHAGGDATGDQRTSGADLLVWQREFGRTTSAVQAVPEPTAASLSACCVIMLVRRRRRSSLSRSAPSPQGPSATMV